MKTMERLLMAVFLICFYTAAWAAGESALGKPGSVEPTEMADILVGLISGRTIQSGVGPMNGHLFILQTFI